MKELSIIQRTLIAPKDQTSPDGKLKYKFRKAEDILENVKPILEQTNTAIVLKDNIVEIGGRLFMKSTAMLIDENNATIMTSDAFAELDMNHFGMSAEQKTGCASSYARKYALCGLFAIDDSKDDPDTLPSQEDVLIVEVGKCNTIDQLNTCADEARRLGSQKVCAVIKSKATLMGAEYNKQEKKYELKDE